MIADILRGREYLGKEDQGDTEGHTGGIILRVGRGGDSGKTLDERVICGMSRCQRTRETNQADSKRHHHQ